MMRPRADSWAKPQHPAPIQCTWHLWLMGKKRTDRHTCTDIDQAAWHFKKGIKGAKAACSITKTCCRSTRGAFSPNQEWKSVSVAGASGLLLSFASHCRNDWNDCPYQQAQSYQPDTGFLLRDDPSCFIPLFKNNDLFNIICVYIDWSTAPTS